MRNLGYWDIGHEELGINWDIIALKMGCWDIGPLNLGYWDIHPLNLGYSGYQDPL